jgi:hypothetical protein
MASFLNPVRLVTNKSLADSIGSRKAFIFSIFCLVGGLVATTYLGFGVIGVLSWGIVSGAVGGLLYKGLSALDSWANFGNPDRDHSHSKTTQNGNKKSHECENDKYHGVDSSLFQEVSKPHFTSELKNIIHGEVKNEEGFIDESSLEKEKKLDLDKKISQKSKDNQQAKQALRPLSTKHKEVQKSV